jgi:hypothetical protein
VDTVDHCGATGERPCGGSQQGNISKIHAFPQSNWPFLDGMTCAVVTRQYSVAS